MKPDSRERLQACKVQIGSDRSGSGTIRTHAGVPQCPLVTIKEIAVAQRGKIVPWVNVEDVPAEPLSKREEREFDEYLRKRKVRPRFYADENFPRPALELLRANGMDVRTFTDAELAGHADEDHLNFAVGNGASSCPATATSWMIISSRCAHARPSWCLISVLERRLI